MLESLGFSFDGDQYSLTFEPLTADLADRVLIAIGPFEKHENLYLFTSPQLKISFDCDGSVVVQTKELKESDGSFTILNQVIALVKGPARNLLEWVINQNQELDNEIFFGEVPESYWFLDKIISHINELEAKGLIFDLSLVESDGDQSFIAIDCLDHIKFIPIDQFSKEKQKQSIVDELVKQTSKPEVGLWLQSVYSRHLTSNPYDSNAIHHLLDWMNSTNFDLNKLKSNFPYPKALAQANRWTELENQKLGIKSTKDLEGDDIRTLFTTSEGYTLVKLISVDSKKREGKTMHNCIGTYHLTNDNLYSVRIHGIRVASLDVRGDQVLREAKGRWNKPIEKEHQSSVVECLTFLNVDLASNTSEAANLGLNVVKVILNNQQFSFTVPVSDTRYPLNQFYDLRESGFQHVLYSEKEQHKLNLVAKLPERIQEQALATLNEVESNYLICPFSQRMVTAKGIGHRVVQINNILNKYPEKFWVGIGSELAKEVVRVRKTDNYASISVLDEKFLVKNVLTKRKEFKAILTPNEFKLYERFLCELSDIYNLHNLKYHESHYQTMFNSEFKSLTELLQVPLDYDSRLKKLAQLLPALTAIKKTNYPEVSARGSFNDRLNQARDCLDCRNYTFYKDQKSLAEEVMALVDQAKDAGRQLKSLLDELTETAGSFIDFYQELGTELLAFTKVFDLVTQEINLPGIKDYRELFDNLDLETRIQHLGLDKGRIKELASEADSAQSLINELLDLEKKISKAMDNFSKIKAESCPCDDCDAEASVRANQEDFDLDFNLGFSWLDFDFQWDSLSEAARLLNDLSEEPRDFKRNIMGFFRDYGDT